MRSGWRSQHPGTAGGGNPAGSRTGAPGPSVAAYLLEVVGDVYDQDYGGFGSITKFPYANVLSLILLILQTGSIGELEDDADHDVWMPWAPAACTTTSRVASSGIRPIGNGRSRITRRCSRTTPALLAVYAEAAHVTGNKEYERVARDIYRYMTACCSIPIWELFAAARTLTRIITVWTPPPGKRPRQPYVDPTIFSGWNALAASSLLRGFQVLGDLEIATARHCRPGVRLGADVGPADAGLSHYWDGEAHLPGMLSDTGRLLDGLHRRL